MINDQVKKRGFALPSQWKGLIIIVLVIGIFFRFYHLDQKAYWFDETFTSLQASGYTVQEMVEELPRDRPFPVQQLQQFQTLNRSRTLKHTINSLVKEDPHHTPLYHILLRTWMQVFGSSVAAVRGFSAIFSLLALPILYGLCLELFDSPVVAGVAIALFAVSPFQVLYAQEAREYSLWTVTTLLASIGLLKLLNKPNIKHFIGYTSTLILLIYTHVFSVFIFLGQGIYVAILNQWKWGKTGKYYFIATSLAIISFFPWILVIFNSRKKIETSVGWTLKPSNPLGLVKFWGLNLNRLFLDTDLEGGIIDLGFKNIFTEILRLILVLAIAALVIYSFYFLCRKTPVKTWGFILSLTGSFAVPFVLADVLLQSQITTVTRYFIPVYLGIQLAVAYFLASQLLNLSLKFWQQILFRLLFVSLLSLGILSCFVNAQATSWWNKSPSRTLDNIKITQIINQSPLPLVVSNQTINDLLALSHTLKPEVQVYWIAKPQKAINTETWTNFTDIYLYHPMGKIKKRLQTKENFTIAPAYPSEEVRLWKLSK